MEVLPVELRQTILQILDLDSLKSIRLASKAWAFLAEEYLISPSFTTLPHRDDMSRLLAISQHPNFCFRIQNCKLTSVLTFLDVERSSESSQDAIIDFNIVATEFFFGDS